MKRLMATGLLMWFVAIHGLAGTVFAEPEVGQTSAAGDRIRSAVVRIEHRQRFFGTGVSVTKEGLVVFRNTTDLRVPTVLAGDQLKLHFMNGGVRDAVVVGWSDAWGIAFAKIQGGEAQHVLLGRKDTIAAGQPCFSAEFRGETHEYSISEGSVTRVENTWFATNTAMDRFPPIFDANGHLIGITTCKGYEEDPIHTPASIISKLIGELAKEQNLDTGQAYSVSHRTQPESDPSLDRETIVKKTSVKICPHDDDPDSYCWSGTSIGNSLVATCGHHRRKTGTKVTIYFSTGESAAGVVLGLNPITDVGLVKITDVGDWPAAQLALSRQAKVGDKCFVGGYPTKSKQLVLFNTQIEEPERHVWGKVFYTSASAYQTLAGMSGSGVFNADGHLIGIHVGKNEGQPARHIRIEFLLHQWDSLLDAERSLASDKSLK